MQTAKIIEGLVILEKYRDKPDGYNTDAQHDVIYAHATDKPVIEPDLSRMVELGWFQEDVERSGEDFAVSDYDPDECWACFT